MDFLSNLINGLSLGSIYAVIALGYTMVYGIAKMLNFAHGDVIMVGGYIVFSATSYAGLNPYVAILISVIFCTLLGMTIERVAYKPLRNASPLAVLITAIGVSYLLQNLALLVFGAQPKNFTSVVPLDSIKLFDGQLVISGEAIVTIAVTIIIMVALMLFINKTRPGNAMRAVSEDRGAAQLMGVNVNGTIALTFAIGSGLAAIAGVLLCSTYHRRHARYQGLCRRRFRRYRLDSGRHDRRYSHRNNRNFRPSLHLLTDGRCHRFCRAYSGACY